MPYTEKTDRQNVSEETLLEQEFNDLLLELNQDTQDEYFLIARRIVTLSQKNTSFSHHVKLISGY